MAYEVAAPKYVRLAQTIQSRIEDGTYPPGTRVPSENQLVQAFGMSRPTVVRALELLKRDGWLESRQGYGTIVRGRPEVVEQRGRRGREALERDESQIAGRLVEVAEVPVPVRVASALGLPKRAKVLMRRFLVEEDGEAVELVSSYFPAGLAEDTELASAETLAGGVRAHLEARKKIRFDHVTERVSARLPEADEAGLLGLPDGVPVLSVLVIACDASGQALQVSDVLLPADRQELEDTYRLG
ncbi:MULTISPECIES: GntR family transcriptional regulator [Streptomyces]|uniref:GntR family transcriptional regulator n=1 Tax=Streptomyces koelreuteriae TaxID=2838015 RepID=A0ABX8FT73_9ACTN|nr:MULTISPECIES: GntR family transcriptional regulator [Streptomyces]QWB24222.1 GntR family transcriptional regulator [Streptomyces koelreuteriae]UUA07219.1 GntR family transcriptional regulator [Streptomyces koelreuteriae]UUA14848.1 GntR family transcriptional regulator [Streptomyces sp. CRCS-T-1]